MKILIVQAAFGAGGAEKVVAMLAGHWSRTGHDVRVVGLNAQATDSYFPYPVDVTLQAAGSTGGRWKGRAGDVLRVRGAVHAMQAGPGRLVPDQGERDLRARPAGFRRSADRQRAQQS